MKEVLEATRPFLNKYGIFFSQHPRPWGDNTLSIVTELMHTSGTKLTFESIPMPFKDGNIQEAASVMSYLCRYSATQILGIVGSDDDDANIALGHDVKAKAEAGLLPNGEVKTSKQPKPHQTQGTKATPYQEKAVKAPVKQEPKPQQEPIAEVPKEIAAPPAPVQEPSVPSAVDDVQPEPATQVETGAEQDQQEVDEKTEIIIDRGLIACAEAGATPEQLDSWGTRPDKKAVIEEMTEFVIAARQKNNID